MRIMTLPCDGIGPEIMAETLKVVEAANKRFDLGLSFHEEESGFVSLGSRLVLDHSQNRTVAANAIAER